MATKPKTGRGIPAVQADNWESWVILPLDALILKNMPDFDTNVGLYQVGATAKEIHGKLGRDLITVGSLAARVRLLMQAGFARSVRMVGTGGTQTYQKTKVG